MRMLEYADRITESLAGLAALPASPLHAFYWAYLLGAIALATGVYALRDAGGSRSLHGLFAYLFPRGIWSHRSSRVDRRYFLVNTTLGAALLAPLVVSSAVVAYATAGVLEGAFGETGPELPPVLAARLLLALGLLMASDLGFFASHALCHRVGFLWEFHKVHHSAEVMTPVTAMRAHPAQQLLTRTLQGVGTGVTLGGFDYAFGYALDPAGLLGANLFAFLFFTAGANLQHSHVWLSFGPVLSKIFVSPAQHQIHHSVDPRHQGRNLGGVFAIWDWLAGTLYLPRERPELRFGLGDGEEAAYQSVARLYFVPFQRVAGRVARAFEIQRRRIMSLRNTTSLRMQRGALGLALAAALLLTGDSQAGEEKSANTTVFSIQQSSPATAKAAATDSRSQARLPVGAKDYGIIQMNGIVQMNGIIQMSGSPTPSFRRAPGAGANESCSCWDGIGLCKASGDRCVPLGDVGDACTGTCAVEDPDSFGAHATSPASRRLARLQSRYPGRAQQPGIAQMNDITEMNGLLERGEGLTTPARRDSSN
jgi:sterol desaturase/sphingolipid hydroxylase (fatty acid hydroxylase superfamily)